MASCYGVFSSLVGGETPITAPRTSIRNVIRATRAGTDQGNPLEVDHIKDGALFWLVAMTYGAIPSAPDVFPTVEAGVLYDLANIHLSTIEERYKPEDKAASKFEPDACPSKMMGIDVDSDWKTPAILYTCARSRRASFPTNWTFSSWVCVKPYSRLSSASCERDLQLVTISVHSNEFLVLRTVVGRK